MKQTTIPIVGVMLRLFIVASILVLMAFAAFGQEPEATNVFLTNLVGVGEAGTSTNIVSVAATNLPPTILSPGGGDPFDGNGLLLVIIPLLVPILIACAKSVLPLLPGWTLPIIAPALGALMDFLAALALGHQANPLISGLLGSAGVGLREIVDQMKKKSVADSPPAHDRIADNF